MNPNFVQLCKANSSTWLCWSFCGLFRFALGGAASRVLKTEFNPAHVTGIMGYIFASLRSLDWIEVRGIFVETCIRRICIGCDSDRNKKIRMGWWRGNRWSIEWNWWRTGRRWWWRRFWRWWTWRWTVKEISDTRSLFTIWLIRMTIENAHVEEKAAATEALGDLVENCM